MLSNSKFMIFEWDSHDEESQGYIKESIRHKVSDEDGVQWLLYKLYHHGIRYLTYDENIARIDCHRYRPNTIDDIQDKRKKICHNMDVYVWSLLVNLLAIENKSDYIELVTEYDIIDYRKIPVDDVVEVSNDGEEWQVRHFYQYKEGEEYRFGVFAHGTDSHTGCTSDIEWWKYLTTRNIPIKDIEDDD